MPPKQTCNGCLKIITNRQFITCPLCKAIYDIDCANVTPERFKIMTKEHKENWCCPQCKNSQRKRDNTDTPVRPVTANIGFAGESQFSDAESNPSNVTMRKKTDEKPLTSSFGPELISFIQTEIRSAIQDSVKTSIESAMAKELAAIRADLATIKELKSCIEFISADYDRIQTELKESKDAIKLLSKENNSLSSRVEDLSVRLNLIEQYNRSTNIEINGVPENKNENLVTITKQLCTTIARPIQDTDVVTCSRIRKMDETNKQPRSIIVKLPNTRVRDDIIAAVSKFNKINADQKLNTAHLGFGGNKSPVFVSEHLSPYNKSLHARTRAAAREHGYRYVWVRNGRIFIRKDDQSPAKQIKCYDSINNL